MKAVVVYESLYGNTAIVAEVIARCLERVADVQLVSLIDTDAGAATAADLLIVGGPTHMHGMSRPSSRRKEVGDAAIPGSADGPGVREWLARLPPAKGVLAAAFDTRLDGARFFTGAASKPIARQLRKRGYRLIVPPESFIVTGGEGPLKAGEIERADAWTEQIVRKVAQDLKPRALAAT